MSETTAMVLVAAITALGSIITALIGWLARKGVNFLDEKTKVLDEASELQRKEAIKNKIVDTVTLVARATMQTYVDEVKAKNADGKLTKEEDLGAYVTQDYSDLFPACAAFGAAGRRGRFDPAFGVGLSVSF
ncbi:MAG: hypothetical protein K6U02_06265 [Firmicutes bacterium]|nr:hypothetical protein [Bacillota bacterium]